MDEQPLWARMAAEILCVTVSECCVVVEGFHPCHSFSHGHRPPEAAASRLNETVSP